MSVFRRTIGLGRRRTGAKIGLAVCTLTAVAAMMAITAPADAAQTPAPQTSPAVPHEFHTYAQDWQCATSYACSAVPYDNGYYVFHFYYYGGYSLRYWHGVGGVKNHQTAGAAIRLYDVNGHQISCFPPNFQRDYVVDLDPVWSIRLTQSHC